MTTECPICGGKVSTKNLEINELIPCSECGSDLEVISIDPPILDSAPEEQEDWGE